MAGKRAKQLSPRQQIFLKQLLITGSIRDAAIRAGINPRSRAAPTTRGIRWLECKHVQQRLRTLKQTVARKDANEVRAYRQKARREALAAIRLWIWTGQGKSAKDRAMKLLYQADQLSRDFQQSLPARAPRCSKVKGQ